MKRPQPRFVIQQVFFFVHHKAADCETWDWNLCWVRLAKSVPDTRTTCAAVYTTRAKNRRGTHQPDHKRPAGSQSQSAGGPRKAKDERKLKKGWVFDPSTHVLTASVRLEDSDRITTPRFSARARERSSDSKESNSGGGSQEVRPPSIYLSRRARNSNPDQTLSQHQKPSVL